MNNSRDFGIDGGKNSSVERSPGSSGKKNTKKSLELAYLKQLKINLKETKEKNKLLKDLIETQNEGINMRTNQCDELDRLAEQRFVIYALRSLSGSNGSDED
ncbi:hypothetical protein ACFE04_029706 [Oxalis oulophora]